MAVLRCRESYAFDTPQGVSRVIRVGDLLDSDDPDVRGREHLFEAVEVASARLRGTTSETATAAPGEARRLSRPGKI